MLDDARSTELWLRHEAIAVESDEVVTGSGALAQRKHLTLIGWTTVDGRKLRSVVFDEATATEDDIDDIIEHAVTCAAWEIEIIKCMQACGPSGDEANFDPPIETLSVHLANGRSLQKSEEAAEHGPSSLIVDADIHAGRTGNATITQPAGESDELREMVPANTRVQLCLDWLCHHALTIIREAPPIGPTNIIEALLAEEAGSATEPSSETEDSSGKAAPATDSEGKAGPPEDASAPADTPTDTDAPRDARRGPAKRTSRNGDSNGSRYRYH